MTSTPDNLTTCGLCPACGFQLRGERIVPGAGVTTFGNAASATLSSVQCLGCTRTLVRVDLDCEGDGYEQGPWVPVASLVL